MAGGRLDLATPNFETKVIFFKLTFIATCLYGSWGIVWLLYDCLWGFIIVGGRLDPATQNFETKVIFLNWRFLPHSHPTRPTLGLLYDIEVSSLQEAV